VLIVGIETAVPFSWPDNMAGAVAVDSLGTCIRARKDWGTGSAIPGAVTSPGGQ